MLHPDHPSKFSNDWLAGQLGKPNALKSFSFEPIGTGQVGDSYRLTLDWADKEGDNLPKTIVAKCPAQDEKSRQTGIQLRNYVIEVRWYQHYASLAKVRTPQCYAADIDDNFENFFLLMEDIENAKQGNQLLGATTEQVQLILAEAAHLHGFRWNDKSLEKVEWLNYNSGNKDFITHFVPQVYPEWCERYQGRIDDNILAMGKDFVARLEKYLAPRDSVIATTHSDLRLDNVLFTDKTGRAVILDWQTLSVGAPMSDVAYCIGTSFASAKERAAAEEGLIENYLKMLGAYQQSYSAKTAWHDYRFAAFSGFLMGVIAAMLVERTERGDEMFAVMAERSGWQALHLDSLSLF